MRKAAYAFGKQLTPAQGKFESLYYALDLNSDDCKAEQAAEEAAKAKKDSRLNPQHDIRYTEASAVHVCHTSGADSNDGSLANPVRSIQYAADLAAASADKDTVVLRAGVHYVADTIYLTAKHSNLNFMSYPGESATVSGGTPLKTTWKKAQMANASMNVYVADISGQVADVPGLQMMDTAGALTRATRARYPNIPGGIETSCGYGCMIGGNKAKWTPPDFNRFGPVDYYTDNQTATQRTDTPSNWFQHYMIGVNGLCSVYDPPVSYWCSEHPSGGGAFAFRTPIGVLADTQVLPNSPYKDASDAIFFVWRPARWANWMFGIGDYNKATGNFSFGSGGNQGARGSNSGGDFFCGEPDGGARLPVRILLRQVVVAALFLLQRDRRPASLDHLCCTAEAGAAEHVRHSVGPDQERENVGHHVHRCSVHLHGPACRPVGGRLGARPDRRRLLARH
jgi:hypothetical protein